jgi:hypothetical protein
MKKEELIKIISDEYDKYCDNILIYPKLIQYIEQIPNYFENINNTLLEREKRRNRLEKDSDSFIQRFLNKHKYYYNTSSELFFEYNENKYTTIKEDDIQHKILSTISENKELTDWKHKIKVTILKQIKERDIFSCIPESKTIQNVINNLSPLIFDTKESCKYFLTVLGDVLLKKSSFTYFINNKCKPFLKDINTLACMLFGTQNLFNVFKFKYYDHKYAFSRLISAHGYMNIDMVVDYISKNNIDIFCVAAHYSQRYGNGDDYLTNKCQDDKLQEYVFYLKNRNESKIVSEFCNVNITNSETCNISWKNIQFLWKQYIENEKIPNIMFNNSLKTHLSEQLKYNSELDVFLDCTSPFLPNVSKFIKFWAENIDTTCLDNDQLELDELCSLINHYEKTNLKEKNIMDLIKHFYPDILIEDNKYVLYVKCKLWDKKKEIIDSLKKYKELTKLHEEMDIPVNEVYQLYSQSKNKFIASKQYFEKFIKDESELYITEDNLIKIKSFDNIF